MGGRESRGEGRNVSVRMQRSEKTRRKWNIEEDRSKDPGIMEMEMELSEAFEPNSAQQMFQNCKESGKT